MLVDIPLSKPSRRITFFAAAYLLCTGINNCAGEIVLDGTMGPKGTLPGTNTNFHIGAEFGKQVGNNLFHSFGKFNVNTGESATFTGPAVIDNVISRVTGGNRSCINGPLRSEIESANLWFINPNGVLFGKNASFAVDGSVHIGTADYLTLGDSGRFDAVNPGKSFLKSSPPEAFGFLAHASSAPPGSINIDRSKLTVGTDETLSLVGRDISIKGATLQADSGRINIAGVGNPETNRKVTIAASGLDIQGFGRQGRIDMDSAKLNVSDESTENGSGTVFIRGGRLQVEDSTIEADNTGKDGNETGISAVLSERVRLSGSKSIITTSTTGRGDAGSITVSAPSVWLENGAAIKANTAGKGGDAGDINIKGARVFVTGGSEIRSSTTSDMGNGGRISLTADDTIVVTGHSPAARESKISSSTASEKAAGKVILSAPTIRIEDGGIIQATSTSPGSAGDITLEKVKHLVVSSGAQIINRTSDRGPGGTVKIDASSGEVRITGQSTAINSNTEGAARHSGKVDITARHLTIDNGAKITASTSGAGKGGNISISANDIEITDGGSISARSESKDSGPSGNITIKNADTMRLRNGGEISVETSGAKAGNIIVEAGTLVHLRNKSKISTSANEGKGDGGNITIDKPTFTVLDGGSKILANAEAGKGGTINITTDFFFAPQDTCPDTSCVNAFANKERGGIDGKVNISATDANVVSGMLALSESFLDPTGLLSERCAARAAEKISSFVVTGREGMLRSPDALLPAPAPIPAAGDARRSKRTGLPRSSMLSTPSRDAETLAFGCER